MAMASFAESESGSAAVMIEWAEAVLVKAGSGPRSVVGRISSLHPFFHCS